MLGQDRDASAPRFRRRREERCRRLRPDACAVAGASRPDPPHWLSGAPSACAGAAATGTFFSQRLGQLRPADADALTRFDLGAQAGDCPIRPVGNRLFQQGRNHTQRRFALHRRWPWRDTRLQRIHTAAAKIAAPQSNRVLPNTERFRNPWTAPAGQRQQHRARPVRFPTITRPRQSRQGNTLFIARHYRRFAAHAQRPQIGADRESQNRRVGQPTGICLDQYAFRLNRQIQSKPMKLMKFHM